MPEETNEKTATAEQVAPAETAQSKPAEAAKPETDWKAEARKWEQRAKENTEKLEALAPLSKLATALGGGDAAQGKTEIEQQAERVAALEKTVSDERLARHRAEIANEKGLTAAQVERLRGTTREELLADADAFIALFPAGTAPKPGTPAPDPSQGAGGTPIDIDARIAAATKAGDVQLAISLQNQKLGKAK